MDRKGLPPLISKSRTYVGENVSTVSVSVLTPLRSAPLMGMMIARQRALRPPSDFADALSYSVDYTRLRIGHDQTIDHLSADGADGAAEQILRELDAVVSELAENGPSPAEVDGLKAHRRLVNADPSVVLGDMDHLAERHLLGLADMSIEDIESGLPASMSPRSAGTSSRPGRRSRSPETPTDRCSTVRPVSSSSGRRASRGSTTTPTTGRFAGMRPWPA